MSSSAPTVSIKLSALSEALARNLKNFESVYGSEISFDDVDYWSIEDNAKWSFANCPSEDNFEVGNLIDDVENSINQEEPSFVGLKALSSILRAMAHKIDED